MPHTKENLSCLLRQPKRSQERMIETQRRSERKSGGRRSAKRQQQFSKGFFGGSHCRSSVSLPAEESICMKLLYSCLRCACGFIPPGCCCTCSTCCIFANSFKFSLPPSGLSRFRATCMQSARYSCSTRGIQLGFYVIFSLFWLFISCSSLPLLLVTGDFGKLPKTFFIFDLMKSWRAVVAFAHVRKCFH